MTTVTQEESTAAEQTKTTTKETLVRNTWQEKFSLISPWFAEVISDTKQQLKSEHLSLDPTFVRKHFHGLPLHRISQEEMRAVYLREILSGNNQLAEFVMNRWLFKNLPLYKFFEARLEKLFSNLETIQIVEDEKARPIIQEAMSSFSLGKIFCFVTLNEVLLSDALFRELQKQALEELSQTMREQEAQELPEKQKFEEEMKKTKEKYEKKIEELHKKHTQEIKALQQELLDTKRLLKEARK